MAFDTRNRPPFGSTDWAAHQFRQMLDREERLMRDVTPAVDRDSERAGAPQQTAQTLVAGQVTPALGVADLWQLPERLRPDYLRNDFTRDKKRGVFNPLPPEARNSFGTDSLDDIQLSAQNRRSMIRQMIDQYEGGYVDDPDDAGGPTKFGITRTGRDEFYRLLRMGPEAARKIARSGITPQNVSRQEAEDIYDVIMRGNKIDLIADPALRDQLLDMTVNLGSTAAASLFLDTLKEHGYEVRIGPNDSAIGSLALNVIRDLARSGDARKLSRINNALVNKRKQYHEASIAAESKNEKFRRGWMNRANSFRILPTGEQR